LQIPVIEGKIIANNLDGSKRHELLSIQTNTDTPIQKFLEGNFIANNLAESKRHEKDHAQMSEVLGLNDETKSFMDESRYLYEPDKQERKEKQLRLPMELDDLTRFSLNRSGEEQIQHYDRKKSFNMAKYDPNLKLDRNKWDNNISDKLFSPSLKFFADQQLLHRRETLMQNSALEKTQSAPDSHYVCFLDAVDMVIIVNCSGNKYG
jgi:hypothetical protein